MADVKYSDMELLKIRSEVQMSEKLIELDLKPIIQRNLERYTGFDRPICDDDWEVIINEYYPIVETSKPAIFFRNPRAFLKPRNKTYIAKQRDPMTEKMVDVQMDSSKSAKTQEALINYILSEIKYKREVRRCNFDGHVMPYAVLWHGFKGDFGMTEERSFFIKKKSLFVKRLSPLRFVWDPAVTIANIDEARWVGRSFDVPLQDLLEDDTLDIDKKVLKGKVGYGQKVQEFKENGTDFIDTTPIATRVLADFANEKYKNSAYSRFVTVYEIFQRPTPKQERDGEKGRVWLLCDEQDKPLRVSKWPYKDDGWPVEILQFNEVQDSMLGISDFDTYAPIVDQENIIINQQLRNAKQLNLAMIAASKVGMANEEDQQKMREGKNKVILYDEENVQGKLSVVSAAGGSSQELYILDQRISQKLDKVSGVNDLRTGAPPKSGEESAESVRLRSQGSSARPAYRQDIMQDFLKASILKLNHYNKQFMTIEDAVRITGSMDIQWSENPTKEEIQADVDVELDVYSMLPENPQEELQQLQLALSMALQATADPTGKVIQKLAQEGYTFELAPLIEQILMRLKIRNPDIFRAIKPEESMGFAPVAELRAAEENVKAIASGNPQVPSPPAPEQDHMSRMGVYSSVKGISDQMGQVEISAMLEQLIMIHQEMLAEIQKKNDTAGQEVDLKAFGIKGVR
jgi:hypothetical protein